jgi:hypothetical protein
MGLAMDAATGTGAFVLIGDVFTIRNHHTAVDGDSMSTLDEKAKAAMDDDAAHASGGKDSGAGGFIILFFIIGFAASMVLGWVIFPKLLYSQKQQPFNFNHALHVEEVDDRLRKLPLLQRRRQLFRHSQAGPMHGLPRRAHGRHRRRSHLRRAICGQGTGSALALLLPPAGLRVLFACRPRDRRQNGLRGLPRPHR